MTPFARISTAVAALLGAALISPVAAIAVPGRTFSGTGSATFDAAPQSQFPVNGVSSEGAIAFHEAHTGRFLLLTISGQPDFPLSQDHPRVIEVPITVSIADHASGSCRTGSKGLLQVRGQTLNPPTPEQLIFSLNDCGLNDAYDEPHAGNRVNLTIETDPVTATPWTYRFEFCVSTPGGPQCKGPPKPEPIRISYSMRSRFLSTLDGLRIFPSSRGEIAPSRWRVSFFGSGCSAGTVEWTVDGQTYTTDRCQLDATVPRLGHTVVTVKSGEASGTESFNLRDRLVLGIGDSLASGEGVPDRPKGKDGRTTPEWGDQQCHRSSRSHQALVAEHLQREQPQNSVTFVHLACSGAAFDQGLFGAYGGIEPSLGPPVAGQLDTFKQLSGGRIPDVVLLSIGVNHAHFGAVLGYCSVLIETLRRNCRDSHVQFDAQTSSFVSGSSSDPTLAEYVHHELGTLPHQFDKLEGRLLSLGVKPSHVFIDAYPDPTRERDGHTYCPHFLQIGPLSMDVEDVRWLALSYALPLNTAITIAAHRHHWQLVNSYLGEFDKHGYCAGHERWIDTIGDSFGLEGSKEGSVHPNYEGHIRIARAEWAMVRREQFPNRP